MRRDGDPGADDRSAAWARLVASRVEPTIPWLVGVLDASGAPSIVLIGPAARPRQPEAEHDRPVADVELLVAPNRLRRAGMALRREGFVRVDRGDRCDTWLRRGLYVELHLALANLEGDADQAPMAHVFWDTHVDWAAVDPGDGLPRKPAPDVD